MMPAKFKVRQVCSAPFPSAFQANVQRFQIRRWLVSQIQWGVNVHPDQGGPPQSGPTIPCGQYISLIDKSQGKTSSL